LGDEQAQEKAEKPDARDQTDFRGGHVECRLELRHVEAKAHASRPVADGGCGEADDGERFEECDAGPPVAKRAVSTVVPDGA
jgi:hypothetical protein